jgi:hypothetical protein
MGGIIEDVKIARQLTESTLFKRGFFKKPSFYSLLI